ncbi:hypothetical protein ACEPAF_8018 [Sanghuangporus sanghuang]
MADAQSTASSAEVEGHVHQQQQQQQPAVVATQSPPQQGQEQEQPQQQQQQQWQQFEQTHLIVDGGQPPQPPQFYPTADQVSAIAFHHNAPENTKAVRWSLRDDVLLCDALVHQHQMGRNRFNGVFQNDAWEEVAEAIKGCEVVTGGAPKNLAHCKARWQRLKVEYRIVKHLRHEPEFAWDEDTQMVIASSDTWDTYVENHKDAQPWRKKKFPCYSRCAFLIEDEGGNDKGDTKFKKRWEARSGSHAPSPNKRATSQIGTHDQDGIGEIDPTLASVSAPVDVGATTGVFPVIKSCHHGTTFVHRFAPEASSATTTVATVAPPLSPGTINSAIQQYQSRLNGNGKRAYPTEEEQDSISKRTSTAISVPPHPVAAAYPQPVPAASNAVYAALPPLAPAPAPAPPPAPASTTTAPAPGPPPSSSSRLTEAITTLESTYTEDGLSELQFVKAIQLFQKRSDALEAYLAIQSRRARVMYLKAELADFGTGAS